MFGQRRGSGLTNRLRHEATQPHVWMACTEEGITWEAKGGAEQQPLSDCPRAAAPTQPGFSCLP